MEKFMNTYNNRTVSWLLSLVIIFSLLSTSLLADQIPDPDVSQKVAIDKMHHKLHIDQSPLKVEEMQALKELNEMTIRDDVKLASVHAKIDELMAVKI